MGCTLVFVVAYVSSRTRLWRNWAEVSLLTGELELKMCKRICECKRVCLSVKLVKEYAQLSVWSV